MALAEVSLLLSLLGVKVPDDLVSSLMPSAAILLARYPVKLPLG